MPPRKPHWFTLRDLLFPGSLVPVALGLWLWAHLVDGGPLVPIAGVVMLIAVASYLSVLWRRYRLLAGFTYIRGPFYSLMVHAGSYAGSLDANAVIGQFAIAFDQWQKAFAWSQIRGFADSALFWVWFEPTTAGVCCLGERMTLPGFSAPRYRKLVVGYRRSSEPLHQTTLQHELGHAIQGALTGSWMVLGHHDRAQKLKLR